MMGISSEANSHDASKRKTSAPRRGVSAGALQAFTRVAKPAPHPRRTHVNAGHLERGQLPWCPKRKNFLPPEAEFLLGPSRHSRGRRSPHPPTPFRVGNAAMRAHDCRRILYVVAAGGAVGSLHPPWGWRVRSPPTRGPDLNSASAPLITCPTPYLSIRISARCDAAIVEHRCPDADSSFGGHASVGWCFDLPHN